MNANAILQATCHTAVGVLIVVGLSDCSGFNPIEPIFAKIITSVRAAATRTHDDLLAATKVALDAVTAHDAAGCYADCGYPLMSDPD